MYPDFYVHPVVGAVRTADLRAYRDLTRPLPTLWLPSIVEAEAQAICNPRVN